MSEQPPISVLFVCLGNICRSPLAEGVFRAVVDERGEGGRYTIDSAGTGGWHAGSAPDPRSIKVAQQHGIDIAGQVCRQVRDDDFSRFDLIFAMDRSNLDELRARSTADKQSRIHLFLDYAHGEPGEVPDPYYGGPNGFVDVYGMIRAASEAVADRLARDPAGASSGQASSIT